MWYRTASFRSVLYRFVLSLFLSTTASLKEKEEVKQHEADVDALHASSSFFGTTSLYHLFCSHRSPHCSMYYYSTFSSFSSTTISSKEEKEVEQYDIDIDASPSFSSSSSATLLCLLFVLTNHCIVWCLATSLYILFVLIDHHIIERGRGGRAR